MTSYNDLSIMDMQPVEALQTPALSPEELTEYMAEATNVSMEAVLYMMKSMEEIEPEFLAEMEQEITAGNQTQVPD